MPGKTLTQAFSIILCDGWAHRRPPDDCGWIPAIEMAKT